MRRKILKTVAVAVCGTMLLSACSCGGKKLVFSTGLSKNELFKIDGSEFTYQEAMLYITTEKNLYENSYGNDIWDKDLGGVTLEEYVKANIKNQLANIKTMNLLAKDQGVKLNEEEEQRAINAANTYFEGLSEQEKEYMGISKKNVEKAYKEYILADKVYTELTKDVNPEISDSEAKIIKVASIYGKTYTMDSQGVRTDYTEDEKEKVKSGLEKLLSEVNDGGDFMTIAANNTDADQVEYQFGKGDMIQEFEDAAYALKADEISGIVETPDGFYIIKCISDYMEDETKARKEEMIKEQKEEYFLNIYNPFVEVLSSEFNESLWEDVKFTEMKDIKVSNFYECVDMSE